MPPYKNSGFSNPQLLQKGVPAYVWGSFDFKVGDTNAALQSVAVAANVATVAALILNGPAPVVGGLISIINSTTQSGVFNVNRAVLTAVVMNQTTGVATMSFGLTTANVANSDSGSVVVEPAEVGETLVAGNSVAVCVQAPEGDSQFTVPFAVTFPTMPTAVTVTLQAAIHDIDSEYTSNANAKVVVAGSAYTAGPYFMATLERGYFYRLNVSGLTGTGTIVGKIG